jgi:hypothetical protein
MSLLVRTWNVFHGNADPPRRRGYLQAMLSSRAPTDQMSSASKSCRCGAS